MSTLKNKASPQHFIICVKEKLIYGKLVIKLKTSQFKKG
ncbi:hypothetical protein bcere0024_031810 [Bacillus cereus Rock4-18]|nr:hypothetical protein bcere0024_031810 [Bacillus cereus Rock4-18]